MVCATARSGLYARAFLSFVKASPNSKANFKILAEANILSDKDNVNRNIYNELLRKEFGFQKTCFDIAAIESLDKNGNECFIEDKGKKYPILCPQYSTDGGHLNEEGKLYIAEELLLFLSEL